MTMNRRDFLLFRTDARKRVFEINCERLYMLYTDARAEAARRENENETPPDGTPRERPAAMPSASVDELFEGLARKLEEVDVLKVIAPQWASAPGFGERLDALLSVFEEKGGRVDMVEA